VQLHELKQFRQLGKKKARDRQKVLCYLVGRESAGKTAGASKKLSLKETARRSAPPGKGGSVEDQSGSTEAGPAGRARDDLLRKERLRHLRPVRGKISSNNKKGKIESRRG